MTKLTSLLLAGVAAAALASAPARAETLINGIDAAFPPFAYVDTDGKPKGFDVEAVDWIAAKMGFTVKHQAVAWEGIIPSLMAKKIDFICSGMGITEKRAQQVNFTDPYWSTQNVYLVKKDSKLKPDQLLTGKKKLGVQQGTAEESWLSENAKKHKEWNFTVRQYSSAQMIIGDLLNGRVDAAAMNDAPANDAIKNGVAVKVAGPMGYPENYGCAVRKGDAEILKKLNEGYKMLKADPKWAELKAKYKP